MPFEPNKAWEQLGADPRAAKMMNYVIKQKSSCSEQWRLPCGALTATVKTDLEVDSEKLDGSCYFFFSPLTNSLLVYWNVSHNLAQAF